MVASRNDLEKDEKIYDNDEFQSEETNSAHSDIGKIIELNNFMEVKIIH